MTEQPKSPEWDRIRLRLIQREADVNRLMRRLASLDTWNRTSTDLATSISNLSRRCDAIMELAKALVDRLGYDRAGIRWGTDIVEYGSSGDEVVVHRETIVTSSSEDSIHVEASYAATRSADLEEDLAARLANLCGMLRHPFDGFRLRLAVVAERDSLQQRVAEATSELVTALQHADTARAAAEQAARVRSEFLAHMSHEIRTPMTAILGHADLARNATVERDCGRVLASIQVIRSSGAHLLQLLNDILELARLESGQTQLALAPADIDSLLQEVESLMRVRAVESGLALRFNTQPSVPHALLDVPRLRQVLINVLGNALKFTRQGSVEVRTTWTAEDDDIRFRIEVEDTGPGMAPQALSKIFDEFHIEGSSSGGTGLGLAICRRLMQLMNGRISVQSTLGVGSCFVIEFQGQRGPHVAIRPTRSLSLRIAGTVLLAEDTLTLVDLYQAWLNDLGLTVVHAGDGIKACEAMETQPHRFDAVLLDMQMPRLDGYETAKQIRNLHPNLPIIALTAHAMPGERERTERAGCTDYLAKPFTRAALAEVLQRHVRPVTRRGRVSKMASSDRVLSGLMNEFLDDLRLREIEIRTGLAGDDVLLTRTAHRLAGSAATFGYPELTARAREVEECARTMDRAELSERTEALLDEIQLALSGTRAACKL